MDCMPSEVRFEIYKRCSVSQLKSLACCNSSYREDLVPVLWKTVRIPMQVGYFHDIYILESRYMASIWPQIQLMFDFLFTRKTTDVLVLVCFKLSDSCLIKKNMGQHLGSTRARNIDFFV